MTLFPLRRSAAYSQQRMDMIGRAPDDDRRAVALSKNTRLIGVEFGPNRRRKRRAPVLCAVNEMNEIYRQ